MGVSIYAISEMCMARLGSDKTEYQILCQACKNCYAKVAFLSWTQGKADGVSEVLGGSIYTFTDISPQLDGFTDKYFVLLPSTYISLQHEMGVNMVSYVKGESKPFVRMASGVSSLFAGLLADALGGNQTYEIVGGKMYFPKMKKIEVGNITLKLSVAFSDDPDEELNISPDVVNSIVDMVVLQFSPLPKIMPDTLVK